jgi:simple sugar transport system permease protein
VPTDPAATAAVAAFLEATVRVATPLGLAALGETVTEKSGVVNIGLEGAMLSGALAGALGAWWLGGPWSGLVAAGLAGAAVAALFALVAIYWRGDQIVVGTAVTLGAIGVTGTVYRATFGATGAALSLPSFAALDVPGLAAAPVVGRAIFGQTAPTYLLFALVPAVWWVMTRTQAGLQLRAAGEAPAAAVAAGVNVRRVRAAATVFGGLLGGLAGGALVLAQAGTFAERMTAGRGFIAIAIVVLGRWHPAGALLAALLFGAASALQYAVQAVGAAVPYQLFLMMPYLLCLVALVAGRTRAPAGLGKGW